MRNDYPPTLSLSKPARWTGYAEKRGGETVMGRYRDGDYGSIQPTHERKTRFTGQVVGRIWVKCNPSTARQLGLEWETGFDPKWDWTPHNPCGLNDLGQLCPGHSGICFKGVSFEQVEEEIAAFLGTLPADAVDFVDFQVAAERESYDVRIAD